MNSTLRFGDGNTLDSMDSGFIFKNAVRAWRKVGVVGFATDLESIVADKANFEAQIFGIADIHTFEVFSPNFGFITSGGGPKLEDGGTFVLGIVLLAV